METEKTRYSDEELEEFRTIINEKLALARRDYDQMMAVITNQDSNDVDDTSPTYKALEEGSATQSKEEIITMAARQQKFIQGLKAALVRIENKTYGIDRLTGKLIPKERLKAVPHATLSVESKMMGKK
ncbi:MAG: TraR/DksA family transcriptional regulator [Prevotella sp.]|jgi:RNA polymerase-binding transcription factor DksA|nr:TraR/DksA family transcriptional regulator [Prevotella sp.]